MGHCMHELCRCEHAAYQRHGRHYCTEACANAAVSEATPTGSVCLCGHPECTGAR